MEQSSRTKFHISFLLFTQLYNFFDEKTKEVTRMNFKAALLLCLLLFASFGTIALVSVGAIASSLKAETLALGLGSIQPCGGDPIDNPFPS